MPILANKVALITGASSGIGYATAKLFAREGAKVVVAARRRAPLDALVAEIEASGGSAIAVAGDVRDEVVARTLVETATSKFGGLDIAFNNAGAFGEMRPTPDVPSPSGRTSSRATSPVHSSERSIKFPRCSSGVAAR